MQIFLAFILIMSFQRVLAQNQVKVMTYKEAIESAKEHTLQRERFLASQVLIRSYESEKNKKNQLELVKTLNELTKLFYTEKGQSSFEYGKSLIRSSPIEAIEKFKESLKNEQQNMTVLLHKARTELLLGKCEDARLSSLEALRLNPFYEDLKLLRTQAKVCLQRLIEAKPVLMDLEDSIFTKILKVQVLVIEKKETEALKLVEEIKKIDPLFPESYYWEIQILKKSSEEVQEPLFKYIKLCKSFSFKDYQKYQKEPRVCQEYKNLESEFKSLLEQENKKEQ